MKKLLNLFPHADKVIHAIAGFLITIVCGHLLGLIPIVSIAMGIMAGLVKEVWDSFTGGHSSGHDWIATIAGSLLAAIFL